MKLMMQCLFDQPLGKLWKPFGCKWFFLRSNLLWIIWRQRNDLVINVLQWLVEKHTKLCGIPKYSPMVDLNGNRPSRI